MVYRLSEAAENDVLNIYADGVKNFGIEQAARYHKGLKMTLNMLAEYPQSGKEETAIDPPVRIFTFRSHQIIYSIDDHDIVILRVLNTRQDWKAQLS